MERELVGILEGLGKGRERRGGGRKGKRGSNAIIFEHVFKGSIKVNQKCTRSKL